MDSLTVNQVIADIESKSEYADILHVGWQVSHMIRCRGNTPFIAIDAYDQIKDRDKAKNFMVGVITG